MGYTHLSHFCHENSWAGSVGEVALPLTMLKRSLNSRMTTTSFCHVDQFGGECVSLVIPWMRFFYFILIPFISFEAGLM